MASKKPWTYSLVILAALLVAAVSLNASPEKHTFEYDRSLTLTVVYPPGGPVTKKTPVLLALPPLLGTESHVDQGLDTYWEALDADNKISLAAKPVSAGGVPGAILVRNQYGD